MSPQDPAWGEPAMDRLEALLIDWIPRYWAAGKNYLTSLSAAPAGATVRFAAAVEMAERLRRRAFLRMSGTGTCARRRATRSRDIAASPVEAS
jgi:hypothetical protein